MKTAIAILNWNGKQLLEKYLPTVVQYSHEAKIYIVDNQSTDDSTVWLLKNYPEINIIQNEKNFGYAQGYNLALPKIDADIICLLNSDVAVSPNWLSPVLDLFEKNENIAAIQPKILSDRNHQNFDYAGASGGFIDALGYPYCRGRLLFNIEKDKNQYDNAQPIFWASGACLFVRKNVFEALHGFDERFFAHQEEIDLCWRIHQLNKEVWVCPESMVYHWGGATLKENSPQKTYLNFRNNLWMLYKNLPNNTKFFILPIRLILDGFTAILFLFKNGFAHLLAIAKAHFAFYGFILKDMHPNPSKNKKIAYFDTYFIPWQYFLKGKKTFSALKNEHPKRNTNH